MSEIKLNEWRWGVVPELPKKAVILLGACYAASPSNHPTNAILSNYYTRDNTERWYAVLSLGPPVMPEPELRLPEGWSVLEDDHGPVHILAVTTSLSSYPMNGDDGRRCAEFHRVIMPTRRECIEEINRILGGGK